MNDRNSVEFLPISVGVAPAPPLVVPKNPDGTVTLSEGNRGRVVDDRRDKHIPAAVGRLDRRLTARTAFAGNELVMVDGVLRLRSGS